ncbi:hypothetical protein MBO_01905 [Moraxella bovoculi 237]|uniref:Uncharacterized protein n=1 Tax=Moraxella bovoculi 237 TaxID=743974 RepID=A0A066UP24_9GAMM|nr:DUF2798 domain-containing protein [Moraxella bovoculi]KDN25909.1 hypothetical protein MBO_01905 [Moraxella bovoculi 237]
MSGIMAFLMSAVSAVVNTGFGGKYFTRVIGAYLIAFPHCFCLCGDTKTSCDEIGGFNHQKIVRPI